MNFFPFFQWNKIHILYFSSNNIFHSFDIFFHSTFFYFDVFSFGIFSFDIYFFRHFFRHFFFRHFFLSAFSIHTLNYAAHEMRQKTVSMIDDISYSLNWFQFNVNNKLTLYLVSNLTEIKFIQFLSTAKST